MPLLNKTYFVNLERTIYFFFITCFSDFLRDELFQKTVYFTFTRSVSGRDPKGEIMAVRQNAGMLYSTPE